HSPERRATRSRPSAIQARIAATTKPGNKSRGSIREGKRLEGRSRRTILPAPLAYSCSLDVARTFRRARRKGELHETLSHFAPTPLDRRRCRLRAAIAEDVFEWKSERAAEAGAALHGREDRANV